MHKGWNHCITLIFPGRDPGPPGVASLPQLLYAGGYIQVRCRIALWPLTPKFDWATRLFLKFDMGHGAYQHATGL